MMKNFLSAFTRNCVRPCIYRALRFAAYALCACLLAGRFLSGKLNGLPASAFALCAVLFALGAWLNYLRLQGVNIPKPIQLKQKKKKQFLPYEDIDDHIDEMNGNTENLEADELSACCVVSDLADAAVCVILSFLF